MMARRVSADELARSLVQEFMAALNEATEAAHRSVLDGTISCKECRALVLEQNSEGHAAWHRPHPPRRGAS